MSLKTSQTAATTVSTKQSSQGLNLPSSFQIFIKMCLLLLVSFHSFFHHLFLVMKHQRKNIHRKIHAWHAQCLILWMWWQIFPGCLERARSQPLMLSALLVPLCIRYPLFSFQMLLRHKLLCKAHGWLAEMSLVHPKAYPVLCFTYQLTLCHCLNWIPWFLKPGVIFVKCQRDLLSFLKMILVSVIRGISRAPSHLMILKKMVATEDTYY